LQNKTRLKTKRNRSEDEQGDKREKGIGKDEEDLPLRFD
jgi:hypothetical protein